MNELLEYIKEGINTTEFSWPMLKHCADFHMDTKDDSRAKVAAIALIKGMTLRESTDSNAYVILAEDIPHVDSRYIDELYIFIGSSEQDVIEYIRQKFSKPFIELECTAAEDVRKTKFYRIVKWSKEDSKGTVTAYFNSDYYSFDEVLKFAQNTSSKFGCELTVTGNK